MEKDILLLYNPRAGDTFFQFEIDRFLRVFGEMHCPIRIFQSQAPGDMTTCLERIRMDELSMIIVAGGDGTFSEVLQSVMKGAVSVPIGLIPAGTSNNIAQYLGMPDRYDQCFEVLFKRNLAMFDVGEVNGHYFLSRCCYGSMARAFYTTKQEYKNTFGKMAYSYRAMRLRGDTESFDLRITTPQGVFEDSFVYFLVVNGSGSKMDSSFSVEDTKENALEFIGIRNVSPRANKRMLKKVLRRIPKQHKSILRLTANEIYVERIGDNAMLPFAVDGEEGPTAPFRFSLHSKALTVISNTTENEM